MTRWNQYIVIFVILLGLGRSVLAADLDNDALDDDWELSHFGSTLLYLGTDDPDNDGASNVIEQAMGTVPTNADSDGDGLSDGLEISTLLSPLDPDVDGDGLCDGPGSTAHCVAGEDLNANGVIDPGESDPTRRDSDGGLSSDYAEVIIDGTDPLDGGDDLYDSDGDGVPDRLEWVGTFTDSFLPDSDFDGLCDGPNTVEGQCVGGEDLNANGMQDAGESDPTDFDSDDDGLCDGPGTIFVVLTCVGDEFELGTSLLLRDSDNDNLSDLAEYNLTHDETGNAIATCPNPLDSDSDWDGLLDGDEVVEVDSILTTSTNPCAQDSNGDGIFDFSVYYDLRETLVDTDGDGLTDFFEESWGKQFSDVLILLNSVTDPQVRALMQARYEERLPADYLNWEITSSTFLNPLTNDTDSDNLSDSTELLGAWVGDSSQLARTNPADIDCDDDGLSDSAEMSGAWSGPLLMDTDQDGLNDGLEKGLTTADVVMLNESLPSGVLGTENLESLVLDSDPSTLTSSHNMDTDGDGLNDGDEDANQNGRVDVGETDPNMPDTDGDGLTDDWEQTYFDLCTEGTGPNPTIADADLDTDGDGLAHLQENSAGLSPCNVDTDNDGLCDGSLIVDACVGSEQQAGTTASNPDTDADGLLDGLEWTSTCLNPLLSDVDNDGLLDGEEDQNQDGQRQAELETDPCVADTDADGLNDGLELGIHTEACEEASVVLLTDPLVFDTDGDGVCDGPGTGLSGCVGAEDKNGDGCLSVSETSAREADTDRDGLCDGPIVAENILGCSGGEDLNGDGNVDANETDPLSRDTDGDHLIDGCPDSVPENLCEDQNNNGVLDDGETDPKSADTDGGGINDDEEVLGLGTNPQDRCDDLMDADGDGIDDRVEEALGYDGSLADSDGDTILDVDESQVIVDAFGCSTVGALDTDGDGVFDALDTDSDNDGLLDAQEAGDSDLATPPVNTDATFGEGRADDIPDFQDTDSDGGGFEDGIEIEQGTNPLDPLDDGRGELEIGGEIRGGGCSAISSPSLLGLWLLLGWLRRRDRR